MTYSNPQALDFMRHRRSHPPRMLKGPAPDREAIMTLLELAARAPDHGKLEPWRFVVLERAALDRLAPVLAEHVADYGGDDKAVAKARSTFESPLVIAVVSSPVDNPKIPVGEQILSAGAVCLGLLNAALASGYGAAWLTGPASQPDFAQKHLGLDEKERIAGLIHIGQRGATPPERPRPDIAEKTTFI